MEELMTMNAGQAKRQAKLKEKIGVSKTEVVNQLDGLISATVFHDIYPTIKTVLEEKKINIYVYRRFSDKQIVYGIYAVPHGVPRTFRAYQLEDVICKIERYPSEVSCRKNGKQHRLLKQFADELADS